MPHVTEKNEEKLYKVLKTVPSEPLAVTGVGAGPSLVKNDLIVQSGIYLTFSVMTCF